jgi:hypothetical protein
MAKIKKVTIAVTYPTLLTNITHSDKNIDRAKKFCSTVVTSLIAEEEGKKSGEQAIGKADSQICSKQITDGKDVEGLRVQKGNMVFTFNARTSNIHPSPSFPHPLFLTSCLS